MVGGVWTWDFFKGWFVWGDYSIGGLFRPTEEVEVEVGDFLSASFSDMEGEFVAGEGVGLGEGAGGVD